ncbi:hypothetical protein AVEN_98009-1 [Araneus ventricosus]|uniref:Endonuclease/exonuclease/phosphatase domain-containing protein n=1 Tax=Araneus ventricosus TaxID=182803 RepID=A0A4Y2S6R3_ARAVE|nr:hypothetical protein AVEN_98009-1 [Araneus ventricosus]
MDSKSTFLKFKGLHINLNHAKGASDVVARDMLIGEVEFASLNDPYTFESKVIGFPLSFRKYFFDYQPKAGFIINNHDFNVFTLELSRVFVALDVQVGGKTFILISIYCPPSGDLENQLLCLRSLLIKFPNGMIFIFGDFNAKSSIWGPGDTDKRGRILLDLIIENDLLIVNDSKSLASYSCPSKAQSWIDLFLLKNVSCDNIISWRIDDRINFSDHNFMDFEFSLEIFKTIPKKKSWKTSYLNWFDFKASISSISDSMENCEMDDVDFFVHKFQNAIVNSFWKSRRKRITIGKNAIWWNPFLEMERSRIRALRRRFQATSEPNERIRRKIYSKRN